MSIENPKPKKPAGAYWQFKANVRKEYKNQGLPITEQEILRKWRSTDPIEQEKRSRHEQTFYLQMEVYKEENKTWELAHGITMATKQEEKNRKKRVKYWADKEKSRTEEEKEEKEEKDEKDEKDDQEETE